MRSIAQLACNWLHDHPHAITSRLSLGQPILTFTRRCFRSEVQKFRGSDQSRFKKEFFGIASNVAPPISTVRHSDSPQTEQQRLLPTPAPSHCSMGLPPIQVRLDSEGLALKDASSISLISRAGSIPGGGPRLFEFTDGLLYLLMGGIAAIARASVGSHEPLPDYR